MKKLNLNKETLMPLGQTLNQVQAGVKLTTPATLFPECATGCGCLTYYTCGIVCNSLNACDI